MSRITLLITLVVVLLALPLEAASRHDSAPFADRLQHTFVQLGPRPYYLVDNMDEGPLKQSLSQCAARRAYFRKSDFSIGHRGAPWQFPEHTAESYTAAARMGAGIIECDVTFTRDRELVCRHSQCDLHTTTNILQTPLAAKCSEPFQPAEYDPATGEMLRPASARCCTSDISLAEFKTLKGKMDGANNRARDIAGYLAGTPHWRTEGYSTGTLLSHRESIALINQLGAKFTPELKAPQVPMPFEGEFSQTDYAQKMIDEYRAAGIHPSRVFAQSFNRDDVLYWLSHEPAFGHRAVYLDDRYELAGFDFRDPASYQPSMAELRAQGIRIIAPPMWMLLDLDADNNIIPTAYALAAKAAGLDIITWTLERSAPLDRDGAWYHQSTDAAINNDGDKLHSLHVLATQVGIMGIFSDWPATTTFYANCMGLR